MTDHSKRGDEVDSREETADLPARPAERDGIASTEAYEQDGQVVLYDAENPLAWIEAERAVALERMA